MDINVTLSVLWTLLVFLFICGVVNSVQHSNGNGDGSVLRIFYDRDFLLSLKDKVYNPYTEVLTSDSVLASENNTKKKKNKKRGSRGGVKNRLKRNGIRTPLPAIILSNLRSINNKIDELTALSKFDKDFRESALICFTETWLTDKEEHENINIEGFECIRHDRDVNLTEKERGGGICIFMNKRWAENWTIRDKISAPSYEILTVSFRPFYLPREFGEITIILTYVPGPDDKGSAKAIADCYNKEIARSPNNPVFILGDFNTCDITEQLPLLHQYVHCSTRLNKTLDRCFGNIKDAFAAFSRPALGRSDHVVLHLVPKYRQLLKTDKPSIKTISDWSYNSSESLKACFESTDWDVFFDANLAPDELTDTVSSYVQWCKDLYINDKSIKIFPNNKPWITKELKGVLNEKKIAHMNNDVNKTKELSKIFRSKLSKAKLDYKNKVEQKLIYDARSAWQGLNNMMGRKKRQEKPSSPENPTTFANDLNIFYSRFDTSDYVDACTSICDSLETDIPIEISDEDVKTCFKRVNPHKAAGPDGFHGRILKKCADQLGPVFARVFRLLLSLHFVPPSWKTSHIIPVPKMSGAKLMKDFRPIALTSVLAKRMERIVCDKLTLCVQDLLDPLQFAYRARRGVEDATLSLLHNVTHHLDSANTSVRILFMDMSSAFNTIQHHVLLQKLVDLKINTNLILWIREFLRDRPQRVFLSLKNSSVPSILSDAIILNSGAPQGCILSPVLFSLYINDIQLDNAFISLIKYADDLALMARLKDELSLALYHTQIQRLCLCLKERFLELNVTKTKELVLGHSPNLNLDLVIINNTRVERVDCFRYLGTHIDNKLNFNNHVNCVILKCKQRTYLLRKLKSFDVSKKILSLIYKSLIESVLSFNVVTWHNYLNLRQKNKINGIIKMCNRIVGENGSSISQLYNISLKRKASQCTSDSKHPLYNMFEKMPSGRRYRTPLAKKTLYKKSFVPSAVSLINSL